MPFVSVLLNEGIQMYNDFDRGPGEVLSKVEEYLGRRARTSDHKVNGTKQGEPGDDEYSVDGWWSAIPFSRRVRCGVDSELRDTHSPVIEEA